MFEELQKTIQYTFKDEKFLELALTHSSYVFEHDLPYSKCNERIEFLGDAVLELASSDYLYANYNSEKEGVLTKVRASLVCETALAEVARKINLGNYILLGRGEILSGASDRNSTISDALESVIGAIYLDGGFEPAKKFVCKFIMNDIERHLLSFDSKTILQEKVQAAKMGMIVYKLISEEGPDHDKTFNSEVYIGDVLYGSGSGHSKKISEQNAAYEAILKLN